MHTPFKTTLLTLTLLLTAIITTLAGGHKAYAKTTLASSAEDSYDIKYLKFNLSLTDTSLYIAGSVSTMALVTAPSMSAYVFELDSAMVIDSAKVDGVLLPVSAVGFVRTISLPAALAGGTFFTAQIFYRGTAPTGTGFFNAVTHSVSTGGTHMVYTVSDPWVAKDWWPAKQSATDKIDSVDMFITVPRDVVDGSNGRLVGVDTTVPGYSTFHWQSHYPIDYYLISVAVARYAEYKSYVHFTGSTDSMLVQNFFLDTATFNPLYKANFDSIGLMIDYYSTLFGRYPFWQEKYGVCYTDLPGGMENQTMTTIGTPTTSVIAHELMHQWFGDHVTYATWGEMWLSEGFATFAEQLYLDHFWGPAAGRAHRQSLLNTALSPVCGEVYVTDTSGPATLFYQPTVYDKGQGIVTMLRYLAPQDSLFFKAMRLYQSAYAYGNASIDNMAAIVGGVYGFSVDSFLHQWIYGKGFPRYTITWDQAGSTVVLRLVQTRSCPAFPVHFNTPVQLQLHSAAADTIVQAYNTLDTELFVFNWAQPMDSLIFNPDVLTLSKLATAIRRDTALHNEVKVPYAGAGNVRVFPNPSRNAWQIDNLPDDTLLTLTDTYGRAIWAGRSTHGVTVIPASALPPGSYYLRISGRENAQSIRLIRW